MTEGGRRRVTKEEEEVKREEWGWLYREGEKVNDEMVMVSEKGRKGSEGKEEKGMLQKGGIDRKKGLTKEDRKREGKEGWKWRRERRVTKGEKEERSVVWVELGVQ